jgi:hypothetical protein
MWTWDSFWFLLHILFVVVAFGPTFAFSAIAAMARKDPAHALAYSKVIHFIEKRMTLPLAAGVPLVGTGMIYTRHVDLRHSEWLGISIILYMAAFFFALVVQLKNTTRMVDLLASMPPGPPPTGATPPAELQTLGARLRLGGIYLQLSFLVILVLMVWKPGAAYN